MMQAPWKKPKGWPYQGPRGISWQLGYRDHNGRVSSKSFATKADAQTWSREYVRADRQDGLRGFLLGPAATDAKGDTTPLAELMIDWLATDAHPDSPGGLAPSTWDSYRSVISRHIIGNPVEREMKKAGQTIEVSPAIKPVGGGGGYAIGQLPAVQFETADVLKQWVQGMRKAGVSASTEARAWKVLSSALSWAVEEDSWPLSTNGCLTMQRRRGTRRASRRAGTGATRRPASGKRRSDLASWALSPLAVERIRLVMLERTSQRTSLFALRDATIISVQYGLGMRNQEVWALSLGDVNGRRATVREVLSYGVLDAGKTEGATGPARRPPIDALLVDDLAAWTSALRAHGYPTAHDDFLVRGDLGGYGAPDGHMTGNQAHTWPGKYFTPAVKEVAKRWPGEHSDILGATPYSLRRGMISLRIRAGEDRQTIAKQCGTSVEMLERSYSFVIEDLEDVGPKPTEEERLSARQLAVAESRQLRLA
jgi:integrase